jgi:hypothetical protein
MTKNLHPEGGYVKSNIAKNFCLLEPRWSDWRGSKTNDG